MLRRTKQGLDQLEQAARQQSVNGNSGAGVVEVMEVPAAVIGGGGDGQLKKVGLGMVGTARQGGGPGGALRRRPRRAGRPSSGAPQPIRRGGGTPAGLGPAKPR